MKTMWQQVAYVSLFAALACGAEGAEGGTDLRQQWLERAPVQYVAKSCSTGFGMRACWVSAVDAGVPVASREQLGGGEWQDEDTASDVVAGIINAATREENDGCTRRITQHETYAFPSQVYSDCGEEGSGVRITCFVPDTLDLSLCEPVTP
jgi:hypothetical protein